MKKTVLLLIILVSILSAQSFRVSIDNAKNVAEVFIKQQRDRSNDLSQLSKKKIQNLYGTSDSYPIINIKNTNDTLAYVINFNPEGFVVISNDYRLNPILVQALVGKFNPNLSDPNNILYQMLLLDIPILRDEVSKSDFPQNLILDVKKAWSGLVAGSTAIKSINEITAWPDEWNGWLTTQWDQGSPYNDYCPRDPNENNRRSAAGCVPLAMAQIINYWGSQKTGLPLSVKFTSADNYITSTQKISVDVTNPDITNLSLKYNDNFDDIAKLIYACGVSVKVDYSAKGSGAKTEDIADALKGKFAFSSAEKLEQNIFTSFWTTLKNNMKNELPAQIAIDINDPLIAIGGHSIVCDGYKISNNSDYFHLNYGWAGSANSNAYYNIPTNWPTANTSIKYAVMNIINKAGISNILKDNLHLNIPSEIKIVIVAPTTGKFKIFLDNTMNTWNWVNQESDFIDLVKGQEYTFTFQVTPKSLNADVKIILKKQSWGIFTSDIDEKEELIEALDTDVIPPFIQITTPSDNSTVSNIVAVSCSVTDEKSGIQKVEFWVNGLLRDAKTTSPYGFSWNTSQYPDGAYKIKAIAYDNADNSNFNEITLNVKNGSTQEPELSSGSVTPSTGTTDQQFNFSVRLKDPSTPMSSNVKVVINNVSFDMTPTGTDWTNGVSYSVSKTNFSVGMYQYYFTATVDGKNLRFPSAPTTLNFSVIQSAVGWNIDVSSLTCETFLGTGVSFNATASIHSNVSTSDKVYKNVPYKFTFYNPSGGVISEKSGILGDIYQGQTITTAETFITPNSTGNCQLVFSIFPELDQLADNNTSSKLIVVGGAGPSKQWFFTTTDVWKWMTPPNDSYTFNGSTFKTTGGNSASNPRYVYVSQNGATAAKINEGNIRMYNSNLIVLVNEAVLSDQVALSFGYDNPDYVVFDNTNITCTAGSEIEFSATCSASTFSVDDASVYSNTTVAPWYSTVITSGGAHSAKFRFNVPSNATPQQNSFYFKCKLGSGQFLRQLYITVIAPAPTITKLNKYSLSADDQITITGTNLGTAGTVKFGSVAAVTIVSWNNTQVVCKAPKKIQNDVLTVTNTDGVSNGLSYTVISSTGAPTIVAPIPDQKITAGVKRTVCDLGSIFSDPNGDSMTYTITSSHLNIKYDADSLIKSKLVIFSTVLQNDNGEMIVKATDPNSNFITDTFKVEITYNSNLKVEIVNVSSFLTEGINVKLYAEVKSQGIPFNYKFNYGKTSTYDNSTEVKTLTGDSSTYHIYSDIIRFDQNTTYHYNFEAVNLGGTSISTDQTFNTALYEKPSNPVLVIPQNNSIDNIQPIVAKWNKSHRGETYRFVISTDSLFTALLLSDSTLTDTVKQLPQLSNLTKYYWRVKAKNIGGESQWSEVCKFTTASGEPEIPSLSVTPNNQSTPSSIGTTSFSVSNTGRGMMNWTASVSSGSDWLTIASGTSGTNSGTISCLYSSNIIGAIRVGTITVTASGASGSPKQVIVTQEAPIGGPGWVPITNQQFNMNIIGQLYFENTLSLNSGDVIGAFVGTECRGIANPTANNGVFFLTVTSNATTGETITFKAYKASTAQITEASPSLPFQNMGEVGTLTNPQKFDAGMKELILILGAGYTWFSVNVNPGDLNLNTLFVPPTLNPAPNDRIIGQSSFASWSGTQWMGSLTAINPKYSYVMKLTTAQVCTLKGQPIPPSSNAISLGAGWTWSGYLPQTQQPLNTALANFSPAPSANDRITAQYSFAAWGGGWIGSLTAMYPGFGYKIKVAIASTLTYPSTYLLSSPNNQEPQSVKNAPTWIPVPNQQFNMSIIGKIQVVGNLIKDPNDIIGAFVGSECRGIASPVTQDGIFFLTVTSNLGTTPGETVEFKVYHAAEDKVLESENAPPSITFVNMGEMGTLNNPWVFSFTPVELTSFGGNIIKNGVNLTWSTATETNNRGFSVERKTELDNWISIGFVEGSGTTTESKRYSFTDSKFSTSGKYYYRLKQIDFDGTYSHSKEIVLDVNFIPTNYTLSQNFPNPFNPSTKISYEIPEETKVSLKVFDVIGNEIRTLVDENQSAGNYEVILDAANLQSGIYFYRLQAGKFTSAKKLILLK